jgi:MSHA biogenesis protein MshN
MSLINQMLQDLDSRRAVSGAQSGLPNDVRPLPPARSIRWPWLLVGSVGLLAVAGALAWYGLARRVEAPPLAVAPGLPPSAVAPIAPAALVPEASVAAADPSVPKSSESEAQLRFATSLHLPQELRAAPAAPAAPTSAPPAPAASPAPEKLAGPARIEKSAPSGSPRERAESEYRKALGELNQGRLGETIDGLRRALKQDAMHTAARQLLLKLLLENKRFDEAAELLQEGLQLQPGQIAWAMSLARLQVERGDLPGAWQTLQHSLPAAGNSADYQGFAAHVLQRLGRNKEAAEHYQSATRLAPSEGRWWLGLGLALEADGHPAEAREALLRAKASGTLGAELMNLIEQKLR